MPSALRHAINRRAFRHCSAEVYRDWARTEAGRNLRGNNVRGKTLAAVSYLGADIPRVRSIADLPRVLASENDDGGGIVRCFSEPSPALRAGEVTSPAALTPSQRLDRLQRDIAALEKRNAAMAAKLARKPVTPWARVKLGANASDVASAFAFVPFTAR